MDSKCSVDKENENGIEMFSIQPDNNVVHYIQTLENKSNSNVTEKKTDITTIHPNISGVSKHVSNHLAESTTDSFTKCSHCGMSCNVKLKALQVSKGTSNSTTLTCVNCITKAEVQKSNPEAKPPYVLLIPKANTTTPYLPAKSKDSPVKCSSDTQHCLQNKTQTYVFLCQKCKKEFPNLSRLHYHNYYHKVQELDPNAVECEKCSKVCMSHSLLKSHKCVSHCPFCGKIFRDFHSFERHSCKAKVQAQARIGPVVKFPTHMNGKVFEQTYDKPYHCKYCPKTFSTVKCYEGHIKKHFNKGMHQCYECAASFDKSSDLVDHYQQHRGFSYPDFSGSKIVEGIFQCFVCAEFFETSKELMEHVASHKKKKTALTVSQRQENAPLKQYSRMNLKSKQHEEQLKDLRFFAAVCQSVTAGNNFNPDIDSIINGLANSTSNSDQTKTIKEDSDTTSYQSFECAENSNKSADSVKHSELHDDMPSDDDVDPKECVESVYSVQEDKTSFLETSCDAYMMKTDDNQCPRYTAEFGTWYKRPNHKNKRCSNKKMKSKSQKNKECSNKKVKSQLQETAKDVQVEIPDGNDGEQFLSNSGTTYHEKKGIVLKEQLHEPIQEMEICFFDAVCQNIVEPSFLSNISIESGVC